MTFYAVLFNRNSIARRIDTLPYHIASEIRHKQWICWCDDDWTAERELALQKTLFRLMRRPYNGQD